MAFEEIVKTSSRGGPGGTQATFGISKSGTGTLRINKEGIEFFRKNRIRLIAGDTVKVLFDNETGKIAIIRDPDGMFRLTQGSGKNETLRLSSNDLAKSIGKNEIYDMELDADKHFDVILTPKDQMAGIER